MKKMNLTGKKTILYIGSALICAGVAATITINILPRPQPPEGIVIPGHQTDQVATATTLCGNNRWRWRQDTGESWQFSYRTDLPGKQNLSIDGTLNALHIKRENQLHYVGFQISPVEVNQGGQRQPQTELLYKNLVFLAGYGFNGELLMTAMPHYLKPHHSQPLISLIELMQINLPQGHDSPTWEVREKDRQGQYLANYHQQASDCSIAKNKMNYSHNASSEADIRLEAFTMQFTMNDFWLDTLQATQSFNHGDEARNEAISLQLQSTPRDATLSLWSLSGETSAQALLEKVILSTANLPQELVAEIELDRAREALREETTEGLLYDLESDVWNMQRHADTVESTYKFSKYLQLFPDKAFEVPAMLNNTLDDNVSARVIHALGVAGTAEAQQVLVSIAEDSERANHKLQSVVALGALEAPEEQTIADLWWIADGNVDELRGDISNDNTALLALGRTASTLKTKDPAASQVITDELLTRLAVTDRTDRDKTLALLESLNNTQANTNAVKEAVLPYKIHGDPRIRKSAAHLLASYDDDKATTSLKQLLVDQNSGVRKSAAESLAYQAKHFQHASTVQSLTDRLKTEPSQSVRITLVRELNDLTGTFPDLKQTLRQHQQDESAESISRMIDELLD